MVILFSGGSGLGGTGSRGQGGVGSFSAILLRRSLSDKIQTKNPTGMHLGYISRTLGEGAGSSRGDLFRVTRPQLALDTPMSTETANEPSPHSISRCLRGVFLELFLMNFISQGCLSDAFPVPFLMSLRLTPEIASGRGIFLVLRGRVL